MTKEFLKTKEEITDWLDRHEVKKYTLVSHEQYGYVVDLAGHVNLGKRKLTHIPVKFNIVKGHFFCNDNQLSSLEFCPTIVGGGFYCNSNQLTSLEFCPKSVGGHFQCTDNEITSLEYCPQSLGGEFDCEGNVLLGSVQKIFDFKEIYNLHKKIADIKKERELLVEHIAPDFEVGNKNNVKPFKV